MLMELKEMSNVITKDIPQKIRDLFMTIMSLASSKYTGQIVLNFNEGALGKVYKSKERLM